MLEIHLAIAFSCRRGMRLQTTFDLSVKNPNGGEEVKPRRPKEIMAETAALDAESTEGLAGIRRLL